MAYSINTASRKRLVLGTGIAIFGLILSGAVIGIFPSYGHLLILAISIGLVFAGARGIISYSRAESWIPVEATLLEIKEDWIDVILQYSALRHFYPQIKYQYSFREMNYTSDTVSFGIENIWVPEFDSWGIRTQESARFWNSWKKGQKITAYVNEKNPSESVIIRKVSDKNRSQQLALVGGGVLIGLAWLWIIYA